MASKIAAQDLEIFNLKARIKFLEDKDGGGVEPSGKDATIKGRSLETEEEASIKKSTERGSNDTDELLNVFTSLDAANILTSGVQVVSIPHAAEVPNVDVPTSSGMVPTASPIFITASVVTPYSRRKAREDQRRSEQIARDAKIARIHVEEELKILINGLDRNNKVIARHLHEYEKAAAELTIGEKIELINELIEDFVPMASKEEGERMKRKGLRLEHESPKKMKTSEELWTLVKETLSIRHATSDKEKELWVELKRLFEPDVEDRLWTHTQALMHDPVEWILYDTCGVYHVLTRNQEIFMQVEKDYPLRKGLAIVMISNKLQVENYSQMANDLIMKIHNIANSPRQRDN
nr:hypothetical protein [Tanacetum cinerariifolium]